LRSRQVALYQDGVFAFALALYVPVLD
jgi:hypothetical protein